MLVWLAFAVLTTATVGLLARPLLRAAPLEGVSPAVDTEATLNIYRDQIAEIEREHRQGLIGDAEAAAARSEVARRLIRRAEGGGAAVPLSDRPVGTGLSRRVALIVLGLVPILSIVVYHRLGNPGQPSMPHAERAAIRPEQARIEELIARVEARLAENPSDGAGWDVIAPIYLRLGRFDDAANAFAQAIRLKGESMARLSGLAEAAVSGSQSGIPPVAREAYARILKLDSSRLDARFWLAIAMEQDGRAAEARGEYEAILKVSPADAPWRKIVAERLAATGGSPGAIPPAPTQPTPAPAAGAATASGSAPGPGRSEIDAASKLSAEERAVMIRGMVDGLARRLAENGADPAGWQRLLRAYIVLGEKEKAATALASARRALAGDSAGLAALESAARELGLTP